MENYQRCKQAEISIHAPSRERPNGSPTGGIYTYISIHAPSRERRNICVVSLKILQFQSTLPRGSDLVLLQERHIYIIISIHAPSRERRGYAEDKFIKGGISIHAPSRERLYICRAQVLCLAISIHAPSRERQRSYQQQ